MKKIPFYSELCYVFGNIAIAFGCAFMEKAGFGLSTIVAPAYVLSETTGISFGDTEYLFQGFLLILLIAVLRKFRISYLLSFATAFLYGNLLKLCMFIVSWIPESLAATIYMRVLFYVIGIVVCALGVAFMIHTYISPEVYELIIKEIPARFSLDLTRFKTFYDCLSCLSAVILSFIFFGMWHFTGVNIGTVVCAVVNGFLIGCFSKWMDCHLDLKDALPLRSFFEGK